MDWLLLFWLSAGIIFFADSKETLLFEIPSPLKTILISPFDAGEIVTLSMFSALLYTVLRSGETSTSFSSIVILLSDEMIFFICAASSVFKTIP